MRSGSRSVPSSRITWRAASSMPGRSRKRERTVPAPPLPAEEDVRSNVEVAAQREILIDHLDPGTTRVGRTAEAHLAAIEPHGAGGGSNT